MQGLNSQLAIIAAENTTFIVDLCQRQWNVKSEKKVKVTSSVATYPLLKESTKVNHKLARLVPSHDSESEEKKSPIRTQTSFIVNSALSCASQPFGLYRNLITYFVNLCNAS